MRRIGDLGFGKGKTLKGTKWLRRWRLPIIIVLALLCWGLFICIGWLIVDIVTSEPARADILSE